ncbi:hypothetical protein Mapa_017073 [Marchantia paleacea]|nr:hypothetical protein Mapa_017073 [Marchantia paleacea]
MLLLGYHFPIGDPWITDDISPWRFAFESVHPSQCLTFFFFFFCNKNEKSWNISNFHRFFENIG